MAAGEEQPQPVVVRASVLVGQLDRLLQRRVFRRQELLERLAATAKGDRASHHIDGAAARRRGDPAGGPRRHAVRGPAPERLGEGLLEGILRQCEVTREADEGGEDLGALAPEHRLERVARTDAGMLGRVVGDTPVLVRSHGYWSVNPMIGRTSTGPRCTLGISLADLSASSRFLQSTM